MIKPLLTGPRTGYRHPRCYANRDGNCSRKLSKEHFISSALLRRLEYGNTVKISGLAWQQYQEFDLIPIKKLGSKILCDRHNSAMSGLDTEVDRFCSIVREFDRGDGAYNSALSGSAIEHWMLKCLIGLCESKNGTGAIRPECIDILLGNIRWPLGWGLYFSTREPIIYHTDSLRIATLVSPQRVVMAARFFLQGLPMALCLGKPDRDGSFGIWRPQRIELDSKSINLEWDDSHSAQGVFLNRKGSYSGHPPNWQSWERNG